jgi:hypothetical protein
VTGRQGIKKGLARIGFRSDPFIAVFELPACMLSMLVKHNYAGIALKRHPCGLGRLKSSFQQGREMSGEHMVFQGVEGVAERDGCRHAGV